MNSENNFFKNLSNELIEKYRDVENNKVIDMTTLKEVKKKPKKRKAPKFFQAKRKSLPNSDSKKPDIASKKSKSDSTSKRVSNSKKKSLSGKDNVSVESEYDSSSSSEYSDCSESSQYSYSSDHQLENYQKRTSTSSKNVLSRGERMKKAMPKYNFEKERRKNRENKRPSSDDENLSDREGYENKRPKNDERKCAEENRVSRYQMNSCHYPPPPHSYSYYPPPGHDMPPVPYGYHPGYYPYPNYYYSYPYPPHRPALQSFESNFPQEPNVSSSSRQISREYKEISYQQNHFNQTCVNTTYNPRSLNTSNNFGALTNGEQSTSNCSAPKNFEPRKMIEPSSNNKSFDQLKSEAFQDISYQKEWLMKNIKESNKPEVAELLWKVLSDQLPSDKKLPKNSQIYILYDHLQFPYLNINIIDPEWTIIHNGIDNDVLKLSDILFTSLKLKSTPKTLLGIEN